MSSRDMQTRYVINGDASGGIRVMRQMRDEVTGLRKEFDGSSQRSQQFGKSVQDTSHQIAFLQRTALSAGIALATMFSARNTIGTADEYSQMASRIRLVTDSTLEYDMVQQRLMQTARNSYKPLMDVSELFVNSVRPIKEVGFATQDVLDLNEALSAGLVISGTKAQQSAALMDQFSKAMIQGRLQGDSYNSVVQNAPRLQQALTDALGITTAELDRMATAGELTTNKVIPALTSQVGAMVDELERMPTSVEDARVVFNNAWMQYIGQANEAHSATGVLAAGIELAADNIETLAEVGMAAGVVLAGRGVQALGSYTAAVGRRAESERMAAAETQRRMEQDRSAAAQTQRREAAERAQAAQEAQRAQQRARHTLEAARQDMQRVQSSQQMMVAERALETQRLQAQISDRGRQLSLTRLAEIRRTEQVLATQQRAAQLALNTAVGAEASATRLATLSKLEYQRATATATAATISQTAAARASTFAHSSMALAVRGAHGAMALMGGPAGALMLGAYAVYRLSTNMSEASRTAKEIRDSIVDLRTETEQASQAFDGLALSQRNLTMQNLEEEIASQQRVMERSLQQIDRLAQSVSDPNHREGLVAMRAAFEEVGEGIREAGTLAELFEQQFPVGATASHASVIQNLAVQYDDANGALQGLIGRQRDLKPAFDDATSSIDAQTRAMEGNRAAASDYLARMQDSIAQMIDPSNEGQARRWISSQDGGIPPELADSIIQGAIYQDEYREAIERRRKAEQEANAAARQGEQMATAALRKQEQERERIKGMYESQELSMRREIELHGEIGEVAKLRWDLENGSMRGLKVEHQEHLLQLREELSLIEQRSSLINTYIPDLGRLQQLQRDSMAIESLDPNLGNLAAKQLQREIGSMATTGLTVPTSLDPSISGPFGEAERLDREMERYREQYQQRLEVLREFTKEEYGVQEQAQAALAELQRRNMETVEQYERQSRQARLAGNASMYGDLAGLAQVFAGEQSSIYRGLFLVHKAYSMASTMASSYQAIAQAWASAPFPANVPIVAKTVLSTGALTSALSAVQPTGMSHAGVDRIPKEGTWLLDQGQRVMMSQQADELDRFLARERRAANDAGGGRSDIQVDVEVINQGQPVQATATVERVSDDRFKVRVLQTMREDLASGASGSYAEQHAQMYGMKRGAR